MKSHEVQEFFENNFGSLSQNDFVHIKNGKEYRFSINLRCNARGLMQYSMNCSLEQSSIEFDLRDDSGAIGWSEVRKIQRGKLKLSKATNEKIEAKIEKMKKAAIEQIDYNIDLKESKDNSLQNAKNAVKEAFPNKDYEVSASYKGYGFVAKKDYDQIFMFYHSNDRGIYDIKYNQTISLEQLRNLIS